MLSHPISAIPLLISHLPHVCDLLPLSLPLSQINREDRKTKFWKKRNAETKRSERRNGNGVLCTDAHPTRVQNLENTQTNTHTQRQEDRNRVR